MLLGKLNVINITMIWWIECKETDMQKTIVDLKTVRCLPIF